MASTLTTPRDDGLEMVTTSDPNMAINVTSFGNDTLNGTMGNRSTQPQNNFFAQLNQITLYQVAFKIVQYKHYFLCPVAVIGNTLALLVLIKKINKSSARVFMINLAVWDMMTIVLSTLVYFLNRYNVNLGDHGCRVTSYLVDFSSLYAVIIIVALTMERVLAVWFPLKHRQWFTPRRATITCGLLSLLPGLFMFYYVPVIISFRRPDGRYICQVPKEHLHWINVASNVYMTMYSFLPFGLLILLNGALITAVVRLARRRKEMTSSAEDKITTRVTVMACSVSAAFVILTGPFTIIQALVNSGAWNYKASPQAYAEYALVMSIAQLLASCNHCVNFFLYFVTGNVFRQGLISLLCCRPTRKPGTTTMSQNMSTSYTEKSSVSAKTQM